MFGLFKKDLKLIAPATGKTIDLSQVPDQVFAEKMAGDGVAIEVTGDTIVAPADGELSLVFKTYPLSIGDFEFIFLISLVPLVINEISKLILNMFRK